MEAMKSNKKIKEGYLRRKKGSSRCHKRAAKSDFPFWKKKGKILTRWAQGRKVCLREVAGPNPPCNRKRGISV